MDRCLPQLAYSALVYKGGEGWREHLLRDLNRCPGIRAIPDSDDDAALHRLMTNLRATTWPSSLRSTRSPTIG